MRYYGDCSPANSLYRPLRGIPERFVLDANVILDLLLIVDGLGSFVVSELLRSRFKLMTTTVALDEVKRTLYRGRERLCDLSPLIDNFIQAGEIEVKSPSNNSVNYVSQHDNHLAAVARDCDAAILSEDLPLLYDLDRAHIHARSLREAALSLVEPNEPHQELILFGLGAGADGHVFVKITPDAEVSSSSNRSWYLFDSPNFGSLRYDGTRKAFVFSASVGGELNLPVEIVPGRQYVILLNYCVGHRTSLTMKIRTLGSSNEVVGNSKVPPLVGRPTGTIIVLNSLEKNSGWSGSLQAFTFGPYQLNRKVWRACYSLVGVAPPTLTADLAFKAAILTEIKGDQVRRPLREHVLQLANMSIPGFYPGRGVAEREAKWFE